MPLPILSRVARQLALALTLSLSAMAQGEPPAALKYWIDTPQLDLKTALYYGENGQIALNDQYAVLGSSRDRVESYNSGAVKIFERATGKFVRMYQHPDSQVYSTLRPIAIWGSWLAVGSPGTATSSDSRVYLYNLQNLPYYSPDQSLKNPNAGASYAFGSALAAQGRWLAVGAPGDTTNGTGQVFIFDLESETPTVPVRTLQNPSPNSGDAFGSSLSLFGSKLVVGASGDDSFATNGGAAYVFELAGAAPGTLLATLSHPSHQMDEKFGDEVAISENRVAVGTRFYLSGSTQVGRAWLYDLASETPGTPAQEIQANTAEGPAQHFASALEFAGNYLLIGAMNTASGSTRPGLVFGYDLTNGFSPTPTHVFRGNANIGGNFGRGLAVWGSAFIVAAYRDDLSGADVGAGYLFDLNSATPTQSLRAFAKSSPARHEYFGSAVAVSGRRMVVGAPGHSFPQTGELSAGEAYIYDISGEQPVRQQKLRRTTPKTEDSFGKYVAIDGATVAVVHGSWSSTNPTGGVDVFDLESENPTVPFLTYQQPNLRDYSVAVSGPLILIGCPGEMLSNGRKGRVLLYDRRSATPTVPVRIFETPAANSGPNGDLFGWAVAFAGRRIFIGAPSSVLANSATGKVYQYDLDSENPGVPMASFVAPDAAAGDWFGKSVAISRNNLIVGAPHKTVSGQAYAGQVYRYDLASGNPTVAKAVFAAPLIEGYATFGNHLSIFQRNLLVGTSNGFGVVNSSAYLFDLESASPTLPTQQFQSILNRLGDSAGAGATITPHYIAFGVLGDSREQPAGGSVAVYSAPDIATYVPDLVRVSPALTQDTITLTIEVPEAAQPGSVKLRFSGAATSELQLAARFETAGLHTFTCQASNPTASADVASGAPLADGAYDVTVSYRDTTGHPAAVSDIVPIAIDRTGPQVSIAPVIVSEATSSAGSAVTLTATAVDTFDVAPTITFSPASGSIFPLGDSTVTVTGTDALGNSASATTIVRVRDTTAPAIIPPSNIVIEATSSNGAVVNYPAATISDAVGVTTYSYSKPSGSIFSLGATAVSISARDSANNLQTVSFTITVQDSTPPQAVPPADLTLEATSALGAVAAYPVTTATDTVGVASITYTPAAGSWLPLGITTVQRVVQDVGGNSLPHFFAVTVRDTLAPRFNGVSTQVLSLPAEGVISLPDFTELVASATTEAVALIRVSQTPAPGSEVGLGRHQLSFTLEDSSGNTSTGALVLLVTSARPEEGPEVELSATTGAAAPGAGTPSGPPAGSTLSAFGVPALSDLRHLASRVTLRHGRSLFAGIYRQDTLGNATLPAFVGKVAPGFLATEGSAKYISVGEPLLATGGEIAFTGAVSGKGIPATGNQAVWTDLFTDELAAVLVEGTRVPGLPEFSKLKTVNTLAMADGALYARVTLAPARGLVVAGKDDQALVRLHSPTAGTLLLRTGAELAGSRVIALSTPQTAQGSLGQGRWVGENGECLVKASLANGKTALVSITRAGVATAVLLTGASAEGVDENTAWLKFGVPAFGSAAGGWVADATLKISSPTTTAYSDAVLIWSEDGVSSIPIAREGGATGLPLESAAPNSVAPTFSSFLSPLVNATGHVAFQATLKGSGLRATNSQGIWWGAPEAPELLARLGDPVPDETGLPLGGQTFGSFHTLALPNGSTAGPLVVAKIAGRAPAVSAANNLGLFATDSTGTLRMVLRTQQEVAPGKVIKSFKLLDAPAQTYGAARSYNASGSVVVWAAYRNGTSGLLRVDIP